MHSEVVGLAAETAATIGGFRLNGNGLSPHFIPTPFSTYDIEALLENRSYLVAPV